MIAVGETAPDFALKDSDNHEISLKSLRGKFVLLLFYPRDNSMICTMQMCQYRDNWNAIAQIGIEVLAINPASAEKHKSFKEGKDLPFPVLSDADSQVAEKYDARNIFGMTKRAYVLIAPDGKIVYSHNEIIASFYTSVEDLAAIVKKHVELFKPYKVSF
ncbi:MAG: peroxiredoxin [Bacteroidota bacterium]